MDSNHDSINGELHSVDEYATVTTIVNDFYPLTEYNDNDNLTLIYGPRRDSLYVIIPITVIYLIIFVTGVIGNISTCIVISKNRSMHTATNYYLFRYRLIHISKRMQFILVVILCANVEFFRLFLRKFSFSGPYWRTNMYLTCQC